MKQPVVIIQAGGRGSRLRHHTWNKPKALVSVAGSPILYNAFDTFSDARFIVIGDYRFDVIKSYLKVVKPDVPVSLVKASGKGTIAGISDALKLVDDDTPIIILWSDIVFSNHPLMPYPKKTTICVTNEFLCRWNYSSELGKLVEIPSNANGIMGCFYFTKKSDLGSIPNDGEFVRWLSSVDINFEIKTVENVVEVGDFKTLEETNDRAGFCRFFNEVEVSENEVTKRVIVPEYQSVHERELDWYDKVSSLGYTNIPKIKSKNPLVMERIMGLHAYQFKFLSDTEKSLIINNYFDTLDKLHSLKSGPASVEALREVYVDKTISRVFEISHLIPHFTKDVITINGIKVKNIFSEHYHNIFDKIFELIEVREFRSIHGDCTFSNTIVDENLDIKLIDPRGYFSQPGILGDPNYDFAKFYYSAIGGYDLFNRRAFKLHFDDETAEIMMPEPIMRKQSYSMFQERFSNKRLKSIEVAHALVWLSLSGYAKDDYDSAIGAFYLGLYWMERALN